MSTAPDTLREILEDVARINGLEDLKLNDRQLVALDAYIRREEQRDTIADLEALLLRAVELLKRHKFPKRRAWSRWELQAATLLADLKEARPDLDAHAEQLAAP